VIHRERQNAARAGFTIVELLVSITIAGMLVGLFLVVFFNAFNSMNLGGRQLDVQQQMKTALASVAAKIQMGQTNWPPLPFAVNDSTIIVTRYATMGDVYPLRDTWHSDSSNSFRFYMLDPGLDVTQYVSDDHIHRMVYYVDRTDPGNLKLIEVDSLRSGTSTIRRVVLEHVVAVQFDLPEFQGGSAPYTTPAETGMIIEVTAQSEKRQRRMGGSQDIGGRMHVITRAAIRN
jgi:prepilin-type N-terminal cleavage/methylation domain-containing protein